MRVAEESFLEMLNITATERLLQHTVIAVFKNSSAPWSL